MVFSSVLFLFLFLPLVLVPYLLMPAAWRNAWLLVASLFFYAWGETGYVVLMVLSAGVNYGLGTLAARRGSWHAGAAVGLAVTANLALLAVLKYANFAIDNLNVALSAAGLAPLELAEIHLPIGISFFTFQAMSYVIDVYRGDAEAQPNPLDVALYIALFPQLIAGPIVRYRDVARQLLERVVTRQGFAYGVRRFVLGLGKKVLLADTLAVPADAVFGLAPSQLTPSLAWAGVICYTLQIYFDFSGYSDMAIGLGHMLGFRFRENFNYPYIARSLRDFWRRWHISLSSWFRDYLYIPLGGSRRGRRRTYLNLLTVFFLCGLWHGASWSFVLWGLFHGGFLVLERLRWGRLIASAPAWLRHVYTLGVVMVGWVLFRAETWTAAKGLLRAMAGFPAAADSVHHLGMYLDRPHWLALAVGLVAATPIARPLAAGPENGSGGRLLALGELAVCGAIFVACAVTLAAQTHTPFIYFRF